MTTKHIAHLSIFHMQPSPYQPCEVYQRTGPNTYTPPNDPSQYSIPVQRVYKRNVPYAPYIPTDPPLHTTITPANQHLYHAAKGCRGRPRAFTLPISSSPSEEDAYLQELRAWSKQHLDI